MPQNPRSRTLEIVAVTAATTGLAMIPLHRLPSSVQIGYVVLPAAAGVGITLAALRRALSRRAESAPPAARRRRTQQVTVVALPFVVGGIFAGSSAASISLDRGVENLLRRHGVPAPRVAMGLASGALSLAMSALEDRDPQQGEELTSGPSAR